MDSEQQRNSVNEHIEKFREHLAQPDGAALRKLLKPFGLKPGQVQDLPSTVICEPGRKAISRFPDPDPKSDPGIVGIDRYIHKVKIQGLNHLKELAGVPNEVHLANAHSSLGGCGCSKLREVKAHNLPSTSPIQFKELSREQQIAVDDLSYNLVYGYADPKLITQPPYREVVDSILSRAAVLPTFASPNLIVCDHSHVEFAGFSALYFNNVLVIGDGQIFLGNRTKLHAYQITHL